MLKIQKYVVHDLESLIHSAGRSGHGTTTAAQQRPIQAKQTYPICPAT